MVVLLTCVYIGVNFGLHVHVHSTVNTRAHRYVRFEDTISRMMPMKFEVVCDEKPPLSAVYVYVRVVVCTHTHDGPQSGTLNNRKLAMSHAHCSW